MPSSSAGRRGGCARGRAAPAAAPGRVLVVVVLVVAGGGAASSSALRGRLLGGVRLLGLGRARLLGLELGGDRRVVLGAQVDLDAGVPGGVRAVGHQLVLALEGLDLLDGDLELVRDPGVRAALAHPGADLVELRSQRAACHVTAQV